MKTLFNKLSMYKPNPSFLSYYRAYKERNLINLVIELETIHPNWKDCKHCSRVVTRVQKVLFNERTYCGGAGSKQIEIATRSMIRLIHKFLREEY